VILVIIFERCVTSVYLELTISEDSCYVYGPEEGGVASPYHELPREQLTDKLLIFQGIVETMPKDTLMTDKGRTDDYGAVGTDIISDLVTWIRSNDGEVRHVNLEDHVDVGNDPSPDSEPVSPVEGADDVLGAPTKYKGFRLIQGGRS
jgi:hypothetical protein